MTKSQVNFSNDVTKLLNELSHPFRKEIEQLRKIILSTNRELSENVKWNGPNYCFNNEDRITMRIHPTNQVQLIFHRGAKVKAQPKDKMIKDTSGLLTWKENDRAIVTFKKMKDIESSNQELTKIIKDWITATV